MSISLLLHCGLAVSFVLFGAFAVLMGLRLLSKAPQTTAWLPVPATILRSRVVSSHDGFSPEVTYRYAVGSREYESSRVRLVTVTSSAVSRAKAVVRRYPATERVVAFVNPECHSEAVLEPGGQPGSALAFVFTGALFAGIGLYKLLAFLGFIL